MILLSSIIKAEHVVFDYKNNKHINSHTTKTEQPKIKIDSTPQESLYEVYNQREIILKEANEEAARIINNAKRKALNEIAECKQKGYEEGYNAGLEIGKNKGYSLGFESGKVNIVEELKDKNESKLKELANLIALVEEEKQEILSKYEKDLSKLAIDIAEKIIKQKIQENDNIISRIIKSVVSDYRNTEWIKIYISIKDDVISIQADKDLINELNKISKDVKFVVSEELEQGSAIVETPDNIVDAGINTQFKNFKEMVLNKNAV